MPGFFTDGELASDPGLIFDYDVTAGEAFGSGFGRQFDTNPLALVARQARYLNDDLQNIAGGGVDWVDQEKAAGEVQSRGLDLKIPKGGIARHELDMLQYLKQREIEQNTTSARTRGVGPTAAGFAGGLAASLTDPINVASGFIPIVNQVRYAQWLARAGEGVFARAAVRAGAGAIEGAVGAAIIEPIVYAGATSEQLDYGLMDSFLNVTLGGVLGGGLHVIGGAVYDRAGRGAGAPDVEAALRDAAANMPEATQREMFQTAVAALERGERVDVTPVAARVVSDAVRAVDEHPFERLPPVSIDEVINRSVAVPPAAGFVRLYRVEVAPEFRVEAPDYIKVAQQESGQAEAEGRWFSDKTEVLDFYLEDTGAEKARVVFLDVPRETAEAFRVSNTTEEVAGRAVKSFSRDPESEVFLPRDLATAARDVRELKLPPKGDLSVMPGQTTINGRPVAQGQPRGLSDLIPEARADRTQEAFNRQFVEKADEVIAAEKARPKDKIESVRQDEAEFRDMVEEYRGQGRVTAEDDASLKQADELAAWAERRAKAFEAAAGCIEAA